MDGVLTCGAVHSSRAFWGGNDLVIRKLYMYPKSMIKASSHKNRTSLARGHSSLYLGFLATGHWAKERFKHFL